MQKAYHSHYKLNNSSKWHSLRVGTVPSNKSKFCHTMNAVTY